MNKTILDTAKELLKAAKENPQQFEDVSKAQTKHDRCVEHVKENSPDIKNPHAACVAVGVKPSKWKKGEKPMKKDDMPHAPNTPEDKAHDVAEEDESIKHALAILDTPEKQRKMLEHLRTLVDQEQLRSPNNQEAGETPAHEQAENKMDKSELLKTAKELLKAAQETPEKFTELSKANPSTAPAPKPNIPAKPAAPSAKIPTPPMNKPMKPGRMTKEEIQGELKKEWKPRFKKEVC